MRRRAQAVEQPRFRQHERAAADRRDPATARGRRAQRRDHAARGRRERHGRAGDDDRIGIGEGIETKRGPQFEQVAGDARLLAADAHAVRLLDVGRAHACECVARNAQIERDDVGQCKNGDGVHDDEVREVVAGIR
ncbi:hypothetical protein WL73_14025 [Burkholderia ubonensis]|uniref:Uncharacterized protein n=1 Tax=Burkholderia ubonensis TaxID=101571 RepID=A0A107G0U4_9BURK|nr:hypothetical protein WL73_14025 [Burkholderia ubonensis]